MNASSSSAPHAEIVGAGFAGLATALSLTREGWSVRVHEAASEVRDFGAGILIWRNGMLALDALGIGEAVRAHSHQPPFYETRRNGESMSLELPDFPYWTMSRPNLHRTMADAVTAVGVEVVTNSRILSATTDGTITSENGDTFSADLVIGADGAGSAVRDSLDFAQERHRYKDGVARLLIPRPDEFAGVEWDRIIDFWTFEPDVMRILYVPCGMGQIYVGLMAETSNEGASRIPIDAEVWSERFPLLAPLVELAAQADGGRHDSYQTRKVTPWSAGKVALVGDAANAMCPAMAQGAGMAIVNAHALGVALREETTIEGALTLWEKRDRPMTDLTQDRSAFMAESRSFAKGNQWSDTLLETALSIPTGTSL